MFYLKVKDLEERTALLEYLKKSDILAVFHYIPLHSAPAGLTFGTFTGLDTFTTKESERVIRLPMYYELENHVMQTVLEVIRSFFTNVPHL